MSEGENMSASFALIKFKKTGNIYYGCYEGTSDILLPFIYTAEECYNPETDCYEAIRYGRTHIEDKHWEFPINECNDLDEVEIYSDYGGGFYWQGSGSESLRSIYEGCNFGEDVDEWVDEIPDWVTDFLNSLN